MYLWVVERMYKKCFCKRHMSKLQIKVVYVFFILINLEYEKTCWIATTWFSYIYTYIYIYIYLYIYIYIYNHIYIYVIHIYTYISYAWLSYNIVMWLLCNMLIYHVYIDIYMINKYIFIVYIYIYIYRIFILFIVCIYIYIYIHIYIYEDFKKDK